MIPALLLALTQVAPALATPAPREAPQRDIVVTGKRLDTTEQALKDCLARACPPDQEIAAALAHADNQFANGDYVPARRTLWQTIGRVGRHAKTFPTQVAGLWRAESLVSAHLGLSESMQSSQFEAADALRAGLPAGDAAVLLQQLEVADVFARRGKIDMGRAKYQAVAQEAKRRQLPAVHGLALLRLVTLEAVAARIDPASYQQSLRKAVARVTSTREPELEPFRGAARLMWARFRASQGDMTEIDRIAASYADAPSSRPMLLWQPATDYRGSMLEVGDLFPQRKLTLVTEQPNKALSESWFLGQWVDVGYAIGADGRVSGIEVVRESPTLRREWLKPVLSGIAKRRYTPVTVPQGADGLRRIERYTLTAFREEQLGSRLKTRAVPRIEMLELSADPAKAAPPPG